MAKPQNVELGLFYCDISRYLLILLGLEEGMYMQAIIQQKAFKWWEKSALHDFVYTLHERSSLPNSSNKMDYFA